MKMWGAVGFVPGAYNTSDHLQGRKIVYKLINEMVTFINCREKDLKSLVTILGTFIFLLTRSIKG